MRAFRAVVMSLLTALIASCGAGAAREAKPPAYETVTVVPFAVEPQALKGVEPRRDQERAVQRLAEAATRQAEKTLVRQRIAAAAERLSAGLPDGVRLAGVVEIPVSVPWKMRRSSARFREDRFVRATVTLLARDGTTLATGSGELRWKDVRWTWGRNYSRSLDDVLAEFAVKAVERATQKLTPQTTEQDRTGESDHESR